MTPDREIQLDAWLALTRQTPTPAAPVRLPMLSGSMAPAIPMGAILEIRVEAPRDCRAGEVVVFQVGDKLIAHRVLLVLKLGPWRCVLEKGDANPGGNWLSHTLVRGRVISVVRDDAEPAVNPTSPDLARRGLREHIRHYLITLGGLRPVSTSEQPHDD